MLRRKVLWIFWMAVFVVCVALAFKILGVVFWAWSPTLAVSLAVIGGVLLFFTVFFGYVAARALIGTQAKPELDLVLTQDSAKEITLEADRDNRLEASISVYITNTGGARADYFTVGLRVPRQLVDNERARAGDRWLFHADFLQECPPGEPQDGEYCRDFINESAYVPAKRWRKAAPGLWLCRIDLRRQLSPGVDECHNIGWRITAAKMGTREGQLTVRLKSKQPQTEGGDKTYA